MKPHHIEEIVISEDAIEKRVDALVVEMQTACKSDNLVMIGILRGSFIFLADLVRGLYRHGVRSRIDFMTLESYGSGTTSSGEVRVIKDIRMDVAGADVMLVDDILDSGRTLTFATRHLLEKGTRSVQTVALLDKPAQRVLPFKADFVGFTVPDEFVVGYGLDYDSFYRELPYIAKVTFTDSP